MTRTALKSLVTPSMTWSLPHLVDSIRYVSGGKPGEQVLACEVHKLRALEVDQLRGENLAIAADHGGIQRLLHRNRGHCQICPWIIAHELGHACLHPASRGTDGTATRGTVLEKGDNPHYVLLRRIAEIFVPRYTEVIDRDSSASKCQFSMILNVASKCPKLDQPAMHHSLNQ